MPRKDYKKYFARGRDGNYAGTEPEREWSDEDLQRMFGQFQDMALRSIPGGQEYGEGASPGGGDSLDTVGAVQGGTPSNGTAGSPAGQSADGLGQIRTWSGFDVGSGARRESLI